MNQHPIFPIAQELIAILDREEVPYMLMGGLAVRFWALPRPTYDVDVTILADDGKVRLLVDRLDREGFVIPEETRRGWLDILHGMRKFTVRRFLEGDSWRIDVFLVTTEYQRAAFARRRSAQFFGTQAWTLAPEDLVLHKLVAGRERDLADVAEILALCRDVDASYLRRWGKALGVESLLEDRLRRTGLG